MFQNSEGGHVRCILCFISGGGQFSCNPTKSKRHWSCGGIGHATACQVNFCPISDSLWPKHTHLTVGGVSCGSWVPVSQSFCGSVGVKNHLAWTATTPWIPMTPGRSAATTTASLTFLGRRRKWPHAVQLLHGLREEALDTWILSHPRGESLRPGKDGKGI